uniref:Ribosomal protein L32 n=1 Tax=Prasiolopsis wulf-kochii TaxID=3239232 RepID=A0A097KK23_9CHLO|nr:ribosomal protein L32 [Prasiolopsis sp. SAG 84.81]
MAVPKKRTSKTKTKVRKTLWKKKATKYAQKAILKRDQINDSSEKKSSTIGFSSSKKQPPKKKN